MGKIENAISQRRKEIQDEIDRKKAHGQSVRDLDRQKELRDKEREMWEEKFHAELKMTEKKIELERTAKASLAKLPQLKITPFKGTAVDWVRFENMFLTQINSRPISDEEKFGYLFESVGPKVRDRIANLKPGTVGYKTAWERLKKEYGQTKVVVNAHMDEIINLTPVRGSNYSKVQEFYEKLSKNYDALQTLEEGEKLHGFVMATLNKLPQVKPDLVRVDGNWENWSMEDLIDALQKWLRRNNTETSTEQHKKSEKHLFTLRGEKPTPYCLFRPLLWNIMVRARMSTNLLLGDIEKAFLKVFIEKVFLKVFIEKVFLKVFLKVLKKKTEMLSDFSSMSKEKSGI